MTGYGLVGSDTPIDDLLAEYFPNVPRNLLYEAFEDETNALLAALLMELRGQRASDSEGNSEAVYFSDEVYISGEMGEVANWNFAASTVLVYNVQTKVHIAFKGSNLQNREIPVDPSEGQTPAEWSPGDGLRASKLWARTDDGSSTAAQVIAFE